MLNLYKKERTQEITLILEHKYDSIPYSSIALLAKQLDFKESLFDIFGNEQWKSMASEMFRLSILNLILTRKINIVYFQTKKSVLFNKINLDSEGFAIYPTENFNQEEEDPLEQSILSILKNMKPDDEENVSILINLVISQFIGADTTGRPEKKFFSTYLNFYAQKHSWLTIKSTDSFFRLITNYQVEIDNAKKIELKKSNAALNNIKIKFRKNELPFRNFLLHVKDIVDKDFQSRYPRD